VGIESLIEPTAGADEVQVTLLVMFCVLPSAYVPVAVNEVAVVAAIDMLGGLTAIDVKGGGTVKTVVPLMAPDVALMVVVPKATLVARPPALMVALAGVEELQVTEPVRSWVGPLE
jgi:hydroxymethylglutaryl-CoA reductase